MYIAIAIVTFLMLVFALVYLLYRFLIGGEPRLWNTEELLQRTGDFYVPGCPQPTIELIQRGIDLLGSIASYIQTIKNNNKRHTLMLSQLLIGQHSEVWAIKEQIVSNNMRIEALTSSYRELVNKIRFVIACIVADGSVIVSHLSRPSVSVAELIVDWIGYLDYLETELNPPLIPGTEHRTSTVLLLAQGIVADAAFDRLPILADALQDAGYPDDKTLAALRTQSEHYTADNWLLKSLTT